MRSPIKWFGGKSWLVPKLLAMTPPHHTSIEGFGGGAWYTLNKPKVECEVVNDINNVLINFWLVLRESVDALVKKCEFIPDSEWFYNTCKMWVEWRQAQDSNMSINMAMAFLYLNTHSYSGMFTGFHGINYVTPGQNQKAWLSKVVELKGPLWERIKHVMFTSRNVFDLLANADQEDTFIYLDPPYFDGGELYSTIPGGKPWSQEDFIRLRKLVHSFTKAKILISIDNGEFFAGDGWRMEEVEKTIKLRAEAEIGREYLVYNYEPPNNKNVSTFDPVDF